MDRNREDLGGKVLAALNGVGPIVPQNDVSVAAACHNERFADANIEAGDGARVERLADIVADAVAGPAKVRVGQIERKHLLCAREQGQVLLARRRGQRKANHLRALLPQRIAVGILPLGLDFEGAHFAVQLLIVAAFKDSDEAHITAAHKTLRMGHERVDTEAVGRRERQREFKFAVLKVE